MHILCTICSDLVNPAENIYVTKCGHVFHHHCLAQWIERSKSCPQCRRKVTEKCMFRFYPTVSNEPNTDDAATLQSRLDDAHLQLRQLKICKTELDCKVNELNEQLKLTTDKVQGYEKKLISKESVVTALKSQLDYIMIQNRETLRLKEENDLLQKKIQALEGLERVLNATADEVEVMLKGYTEVKTIALFATALKRALCESESKKNELRDRLHSTKQKLNVEKGLVAQLQASVMQLNDKVDVARRKYEGLKNKRKASETLNETFQQEDKRPRLSEPSVEVLDTAMLDASPANLSTLVREIESSESPYLRLRQGSYAHALALKPPPQHHLKPSEVAIINAARTNQMSIFRKKEPVKPDPSKIPADLSYDGLGGRSKLDVFPTPKPKPPLKCIPKVSAKHRLRKPNPPVGARDIREMIGDIAKD